jgi:hypothetical protein
LFLLQSCFPHLARFDVLRPEKKRWSTATIVDVDFVGQTHRVKFHFPRTQITSDTWLEAVSDRIAPLHTHTIRHERKRQTKPLHPDPADSEDRQKKQTESKKKKSKTSLIAASATTSESGSVDENEHEYEEIGVGMVEDFEDIGSAEESDEDEMELVDTDDEEEEEEEEDDDGLDEEIEDDDDDSEENEDSIEPEKKAASFPTVTDHSSPDGSPKRDPDCSSEYSRTEEDRGKASGGDSKGFTIPKKRLASQAGSLVPIPKKKKHTLGSASLISNQMKEAPPVASAERSIPRKTESPRKPLDARMHTQNDDRWHQPQRANRDECNVKDQWNFSWKKGPPTIPGNSHSPTFRSPTSSGSNQFPSSHQKGPRTISILSEEQLRKEYDKRREKEMLRESARNERNRISYDAQRHRPSSESLATNDYGRYHQMNHQQNRPSYYPDSRKDSSPVRAGLFDRGDESVQRHRSIHSHTSYDDDVRSRRSDGEVNTAGGHHQYNSPRYADQDFQQNDSRPEEVDVVHDRRRYDNRYYSQQDCSPSKHPRDYTRDDIYDRRSAATSGQHDRGSARDRGYDRYCEDDRRSSDYGRLGDDRYNNRRCYDDEPAAAYDSRYRQDDVRGTTPRHNRDRYRDGGDDDGLDEYSRRMDAYQNRNNYQDRPHKHRNNGYPSPHYRR